MVAFGVNASAYFIIAANSWMQHPVGVEWDDTRHRPAMNNIVAVLTNNTTLAAFPHVIAGALLTAATFVGAIGCWWMARTSWRARQLRLVAAGGDAAVGVEVEETTAPSLVDATPEALDDDAKQLWRPVTRFALWVTIAAGIAVILTGDLQAQIMFKQQPMKMAAAESLCVSEKGAAFSVLSIGRQNNCDNIKHVVAVPGMLLPRRPPVRHRDQGVSGAAEEYTTAFAGNPAYAGQNFAPNLFVTYWSFRAMITWPGSVIIALGGCG